MTMGKVLLSADAESLAMPQLIGLEDTQLDVQDWLLCVSEAHQARHSAQGPIDEAWVVSSDDMAGINLAAALRSDNAKLPIYLVKFDPSDADTVHAKQAGLTGVLSAATFRERFASARSRKDAMRKVAELEPLKLVPPLPPKKEPRAFVLAMMSGSGGVGKSAASAVAAFRCAERGFKTAAIDFDLQFGDLRHLMGEVPSASIDDVLEDPSLAAKLASDIQEAQPGSPALASAPKRLERSEELYAHMLELLDAFAAEFDVVVVNTGSTWTESHAQLLERCNCPVMLLDQRASAIRSCQHALDLCMRLGIATGSFAYALNHCQRGSLFSAVDIANVMQGVQVFELREGGREVEELLGAGLASELTSSKNDFCTSVDAMLGEVLP